MKKHSMIAAGVAASLMAGCSSPEVTEPIPRDDYEWTVSLPEAPTTTFVEPFQVGKYTVRLIRAQDQSPRSDSSIKLEDYTNERLEATPRTTEALAALATNNQLQLQINPIETVTLPYDVSDRLCGIVDKTLDLDEEPSNEDKVTWRKEQDKIIDDIIQYADNVTQPAAVDATMIYFDNITRCYPTALISEDGSLRIIGGDAGVHADTINLDDLNPSTWLHEIGHKIGLGHANSIDCGSSTQPVSDDGGQCVIKEYADTSNVMGNHQSLNFDMLNGYQLARLGALQPNQIIDVTGTAEFDISAIISPDVGTKLLRLKANGKLLPGNVSEQEYYYIELSGSDDKAWCEAANTDTYATQYDHSCLVDQGVSLKIIRAADFAKTRNPMPESLILNLNPETREYRYAELGVETASGSAIFTTNEGMSVSLIEIESTGQATGKATVSIIVPEA